MSTVVMQVHRKASHAIAGMFVAIFESKFGDAEFVEFAETVGDMPSYYSFVAQSPVG